MVTKNLAIIVGSTYHSGVRETLRDWQTGGLVTDFVWVPAEAQVDDRRIVGHLVTGGALHAVDVRSLAGQYQFDRVSVVAMGITLSQSDPARIDHVWSVAMRVRRLVSEDFGVGSVVAVRALCAAGAEAPPVELTDSGGWTDVLISPSDSKGPGVGTRPVPAHSIAEVVVFVASQLAPLAGLWEAVPVGTVDQVGTAHTGYRGRLVRSFYRRLDGSAVEATLKDQAFDTASGYPLPNHGGTPARYADNDAAAVEQMLQAFWVKNGWLITRNREEYVPAEPTPISAGQALREFFAFLGGSLKGAPSAVSRGLVDSTKAAVAQTVQSLVYGDTASAYLVVVNGVDATGKPVGWKETVGAAQQLERKLVNDTPQIDASSVWQSMARASLTLLDYGTHDRDLPPQNPQPVIVRTPASVAPDPDNMFTLKGSVAGRLGPIRVQPADVVHATEVGNQVRLVAQDSQHPTPDADSQLQDMTAWYHASRASFVSRVGERISTELSQRLAEFRERTSGLQQNTDTEDDSEHIIGETHRILGVKMRQVFGYSAAFAAIMFFLSFVGWVPWWLFFTALGLAIVAGFTGAFMLFTRSQSEVFHVIHRARKTNEDARIDLTNRTNTLTEYRQLGEAYEQYLRWADIIGAFVHRPFGARRAHAQGDQVRFDDLPINMGHAEYVVDAPVVADTARYLRTACFYTGWTSEQFHTFVQLGLENAGVQNYPLGGDMHTLFAEKAGGSDSVLTALAQSLRTPVVDPRLETRYWDDMRTRLSRPDMNSARQALLGRIQVSGTHTAESMSDFQGTVGKTNTGVRVEMLDDELLTPDAVSRDKHALEDDIIKTEMYGFGSVLVHTQISGQLTPDDIACATQTTAEVTWDNDQWSSPFGGQAV